LRKIVLIFLLGIIVAGCSVTRSRSKSLSASSGSIITGNVLEDVKNQNVTGKSFFLQKADIEIITKTIDEKFIATIKFAYPDRYLISLKTRTGIEGARIYINKDSVIVNDRINKKLYFVDKFYLEQNFGITPELLALIFGDIILDEKMTSRKFECVEGRLETEINLKGVKFNYVIDCDKRKSVAVKVLNNYVQNGVEINYNKFFKRSGILMPGEIEVNDYKSNIKIKIKIIKIESPWNGNFDFIPGKGYEIIELV
jgi:hypothetical protein